jgi:TM2 domain-containing membrane protein YozV
MSTSPGPGSSGNVLAAVCSVFIPGLRQLVQGRVLLAIFMFVLAGIVWAVSFGTMGWVIHIIAAINAALYRG